MPTVEVVEVVPAPLHKAWEVVNDVESYPRIMDHVLSIRVLETGSDYRLTEWEIDCKGYAMRWVEREEVDAQRHRIEYRQVEGDLGQFSGHWQLRPLADDRCEITLSVAFEMGIPSLCAMFDPVAQRAIQDNSQRMLVALSAAAARASVELAAR